MTGLDQLDLGDGVTEFMGVQYVTIACPVCPFTCLSAGGEHVEHLPELTNHVGEPVPNHKIARTDQ